MKAIRIASLTALLLVPGVLLAGCTSPPNTSISAPTIQGPPGHQFALSFFKKPSGFIAQYTFLAAAKDGPGVGMLSRWSSANVDAFVYELKAAVTRTRVDPVLLSFLPTTDGARLTTWRGFPAAADSVPCSNVRNSCSGVVNVLAVLKDNTIYEVMVNVPTKTEMNAVFNSFRLISQSQLETTACKLVSAPPNPIPGASEAISVKASTLSALQQTDNALLQGTVRAYELAVKAKDTPAMIRAIADAVKTCHGLGLKTGSQLQ